MKRIFTLVFSVIAITVYGQIVSEFDQIENQSINNSVVFNLEKIDKTQIELKLKSQSRGLVSEWFSYTGALNSFISNKKNYYTLLFPDSLISIFEDNNNPGNYITGQVSSYSVGSVFSPSSEIIDFIEHDTLNRYQPFTLDSIEILYNYLRFTDDEIVDTLIINVFTPQNLLYYTDIGKPSGIPKGGSVKYDIKNNKGRDYTMQIVYLLTSKDVVEYNTNGKGSLGFAVDLEVNAGNYGNPIAVTWSYKPGSTYNLTDTLNGDFEQSVPHSKINHFFYWNFNDMEDFDNEEFNNGLFIYNWSNNKRYVESTSYGPLYWRGSSFVDKRCYPIVNYKLTYDPDWVGINENKGQSNFKIYPIPAKDFITISSRNPFGSDTKIEIFNGIGKLIKESNVMVNDGNIIQMDLRDLYKGQYFIKVTNSTGTITKVFTKM